MSLSTTIIFLIFLLQSIINCINPISKKLRFSPESNTATTSATHNHWLQSERLDNVNNLMFKEANDDLPLLMVRAGDHCERKISKHMLPLLLIFG